MNVHCNAVRVKFQAALATKLVCPVLSCPVSIYRSTRLLNQVIADSINFPEPKSESEPEPKPKPKSEFLVSVPERGRGRKRKREACTAHYLSVRDRYLSTLVRAGCICKELVARNLEPCCQVGGFSLTPTASASAARKAHLSSSTSISQRKSKSGSASASENGQVSDNCCGDDNHDENSKPTPKAGGCCDSGRGVCSKVKKAGCCGAEDGDGHYDVMRNSRCFEEREGDCCSSEKVKGDGCDSEKIEDDCCNSEKIEDDCCRSKIAKDDCCSIEKLKDKGCISKGNKVNCCNREKKTSGSCTGEQISAFENIDAQVLNHPDIEKGATLLNHVVLSVQGLTCVGCETKLFRSLQGIPGVSNLRTSLVLSQAEFDLNPKSGPVTEIIKTVEKTTGFTCQRVNNEGHEIDIIIDGDTKAFAERKYLDGVTQMVAIDNQTVRIMYDARIIGARALLESYGDISLKLAGPRASPELESGKKHVRSTAWITITSALLTIPVLVLAWAPLPPRPIIYGGVSLFLATVVQFAIAGPFYPSALRGLIFTHVIEMDLLIVLSTSAAYIFSLVSFAYQIIGRPLPTGEFFETSTLLVTLIMLGRWVSAFARQRAVESVSIKSSRRKRLFYATQMVVMIKKSMLGFYNTVTCSKSGRTHAFRPMA